MFRIAVIEDSPEVLALVRDELRQLAYEVRTAGDGQQGPVEEDLFGLGLRHA